MPWAKLKTTAVSTRLPPHSRKAERVRSVRGDRRVSTRAATSSTRAAGRSHEI